MTSKQGIRWRESAWLVWVLAPIVVVGGCATTPRATADRPAATVTVTEPAVQTTELAVGTSDNEPASPDVHVVEVDKYGISFEVPEGWMTLNAENLLDSSNPAIKSDPVIEEFASRMGTTPKQVVRTLASSMLTVSISGDGAVDGFLDNVNSVGTPQPDYNDDQIKYELARIGAKPGNLEHVSTPVGEVIRVTYTLAAGGMMTAHGVGMYVDVGDAVALITVSSHSPVKADELADQIEASLRSIN